MDTLLIRNGTVVNAEDGTMVQADILAEGSRIRKAEPGICDRPFSNKDAEFREGDLIYEPVLTVKAGEMVWRSVTF